MPELIIPERFRARHYEGLSTYFVTGRSRILDEVIEVPAMTKSGEEIPAKLRIRRLSTQTLEFVAFLRDETTAISEEES